MKRLFLATLVALFCQSSFAQEGVSVNGATLGQPLKDFCESLSGGIYGDPDFTINLLEVSFPMDGFIGYCGYGLFWEHTCRYELLCSAEPQDNVIGAKIEFYTTLHEADVVERALTAKYGKGFNIEEDELDSIYNFKETKGANFFILRKDGLLLGVIRFTVANMLGGHCYIRLGYLLTAAFEQNNEEDSLQNII